MCIHFYSIGSYRYYRSEPSGFRITCLTARHFSGRFLRQNPSLWASFMLEGRSTVYIGGDSGYDAILGNRQTAPAYRPCHPRKRAIQRRLAVYPYDARTASGRDSRAGCGQSPSGAQQQIFTLPSRMGRADPPHRTGSNKGQQLHVIHGIIGSPIIY